MQVRTATPADVPALSRLAARTFALACPPHTPVADIAAHVANELNEQRFQQLLDVASFFVVDDGPELCGYLMLTTEPPPIDTTWRQPLEVKRIYVDERTHGAGVAGALMETAVEQAVEHGNDWIWLGTNKFNERAIRFYRKHGFEIVGERTFTVGGSVESDYVLARPTHTVGT